jgi:hypothetical protein
MGDEGKIEKKKRKREMPRPSMDRGSGFAIHRL